MRLSGRWFPSCGEDKFFDPVDRLRNALQHIDDRWKNRLALNNASLAEKYVSGRFAIALYAKARAVGCDEIHFSPGINLHRSEVSYIVGH